MKLHHFLPEFALILSIAVSNAASLESWHWRNPSPFANSLRSSCFGVGKFVAVGDGGVIHSSPDGLTWDDGRRPVISRQQKVIFANGLFVSVGHQGTIATSTDGNSWTPHDSGVGEQLFAATYGNGRYVACGQNGRLVISTDGTVWLPDSIGTNDLTWITFGNGLFVVAAPNISPGQTAVRVSPDGHSWTTQALPAGTSFFYSSALHDTAFGNSRFVATLSVEAESWGSHYERYVRFYTSTDGTTWSPGAFAKSLLGITEVGYSDMTFAHDNFYEIIAGFILSTSDGNVSSFQYSPPEATSITFGNGTYLLTSTEGKLWTSSDATNWLPDYRGFSTNIRRIIRGGDKYLVVGEDGVAPMLASFDGIKFDAVQGSPALAYLDVEFDGSNYVAAATLGNLFTSSNGNFWVQRNSNTSEDLRGLCRGADRWVAVGPNGTVISSPTGQAWTLRLSGTANDLNGVAYGNHVYVAVGEAGTIITSPDAANWEVQFADTIESLTRVRFLNGQFFALGRNGMILNSIDGIIWEPRESNIALTLRDITFGDGRFVACGFDFNQSGADLSAINVTLQSTNGTDWENITAQVPTHVGLNTIAFLDGSFFICGEHGALLQSDSIDGRPRLLGKWLPENAGFQLIIALNAPAAYRIQARSDVTTGSWEDLAIVTNPVPPYVWTDYEATQHPARFYRLAPR